MPCNKASQSTFAPPSPPSSPFTRVTPSHPNPERSSPPYLYPSALFCRPPSQPQRRLSPSALPLLLAP
eukprot:scaffold92021_cov27-Tisochrysis_lutea.AAC.2